MTVLTWNTAGARGTAAAVALADRLRADVVLLQEAHPTGVWPGPLLGAAVAGRPWGSWILVRRGELHDIALPHYAGWVAGAQWRRAGHGGTLFLFSIHVPTPNAHERRGSYVAEAVQIVAAICAQVPATGRLVIGGDFNVKSLGERLAAEPIQLETAERRALHAFRNQGLAIAWRDVHPRRALPQTLRWRPAPATPFHCDGFLTRGFPPAAMTCDILSSAGTTRVSDHNPVVLQLPAKAGGGRCDEEPLRRTRRRAASGPTRERRTGSPQKRA
jgi:exonuclease III